MKIDTKEIRNKYKIHPLLPNNMTVADLVIDVFRLCDCIDELERGNNNKELYIESLNLKAKPNNIGKFDE